MYLKAPFWSKDSNSESPSAVWELVSSLERQRVYREVMLALRLGLSDARFLRFVAEFDAAINLLCHSQSIPDLQVVPVLFKHSLRDMEDHQVTSIFTVELMEITSPSTDSEVALALRVLEGGCLIYCESNVLARQYKAIPDFEACNGFEEVSILIRDKQVDEKLRLKCGEFLLLLIGHVNGRERPRMATIHEDIRRFLGEKSASLIWAASQFGLSLIQNRD
ncbi:unnamed protein product [Withania somnifera]